MSRKVAFMEGEYYHLFNRGVDKRRIFSDKQDKYRFQKLLFLCNTDQPIHFSVLKDMGRNEIYQTEQKQSPLVSIGSYALMGNHFHLLVRERIQGGISQFMHKLSTAYTMYFNIRNQRTGSLFEGRFRMRHVTDDEYLKHLFAYIHLNPAQHIEPLWKENGVKKLSKIWEYVSSYYFSSLPDFLGCQRPERAILKLDVFPKYFKTTVDVRDDIFDWLSLHPEKEPEFQG